MANEPPDADEPAGAEQPDPAPDGNTEGSGVAAGDGSGADDQADHADAVTASANLEISRDRLKVGATVPARYSPQLLRIGTYVLGSVLVLATIGGGQYLQVPLWVSVPVAVLEVAGGTYLVLTRR